MSYANGIVSAPVSISDVQSALGNTSGDLATLCTASSINMWAKYKPVKNSLIDTTGQWDLSNKVWKSSATWFQGVSPAVCGLIPYETTSFANVKSNTTGGSNGWTYQRPTGGSSSPYRLTDFAMYNHNASPAAFGFSVPEKQESLKEFNAMCGMAAADADNVAIADFNTNVYFGFAFVNSSGTVVYHGTSDTPLTGGVHISSFALTTYGTYTVYPFFCTEAITPTTNSMGNHTYWTVPNVSPATCQVTTAGGTTGVAVAAEWWLNSSTRVNVIITNGSSSTYSANIYIRRVGRKQGSSPYSDEANYASNPVSVPANTEISVRVGAGSTNYNYHAIVVLAGGQTFDVPVTSSGSIVLE